MDLDKIIQKAQNEKDKKTRKDSGKIAKSSNTKASKFKHWWNSLLTYRFFRKINYRGTTWIFTLSLILAFTCYMVPLTDNPPENTIWSTFATSLSIAFLVLFLSLWLGVEVNTLYLYNSFKQFPSTLPFSFEGWNETIRKKEFLDFENWWKKCSLNIELNNIEPLDPKAIEALNALCFLASKKCNRQFYAPFLSESRVVWVSNNLNMEGSANIYVIGVLYEFIYSDLKPFHNQTKLIKKITLTGDSDFMSVSRDTSD